MSDALSARGTFVDQRRAQQALLATAARHTASRRCVPVRASTANLATLDAQRSLYATQQTLVAVRQAALANQVTLDKALGGGWEQQTASR